MRGNPNAPLTLVEYGDYECPFCSRATGSIDEVRDHFGDDCVTCGGICRWSASTRTRWTPPVRPRPPACRGATSRWASRCSVPGLPGMGPPLPLCRQGRGRHQEVRRGRALAEGAAQGAGRRAGCGVDGPQLDTDVLRQRSQASRALGRSESHPCAGELAPPRPNERWGAECEWMAANRDLGANSRASHGLSD